MVPEALLDAGGGKVGEQVETHAQAALVVVLEEEHHCAVEVAAAPRLVGDEQLPDGDGSGVHHATTVSAQKNADVPACGMRAGTSASVKGVEVAGIEPASSRDEPGLLRVQLTCRSTRLLHSRQHVANEPSIS